MYDFYRSAFKFQGRHLMQKKLILMIAVLFGAGALLSAHEDMKPNTSSPSAEFSQLKQLVGTWEGVATHGGKEEKPEQVTTQFKLTAADSAIEETLMPGTPHEMVDMYADE